MKLRKLRENCLWALSWTPIGICTGIVGWSYYVFTTSVCRFLFDHDRVLQGVVYVFAVTIIVTLLLWSYFLATFSSPGYPSETYQTRLRVTTGSLHQDREYDVNVALLERGQLYSPESPTISSSPPPPPLPPNGNGHGGHMAIHYNGSSPNGHIDSDSIPRTIPALQPVGTGAVRRTGDLDQNSVLHVANGHRAGQQQQEQQQLQQHTTRRLGTSEQHGMQDDNDDDDDDDVPLGRFQQAHSRFTVKSDGKMRYCQKCKFEKPDRTHHCSSCKRCVLKMDHHCPWLNNCVGHSNYKPFFLFVLWTAVYCVTLAACTIPVAAIAINLPYDENVFDPQWIFMILIAIIFGLCLVPFAIQHILLMKDNRTTIESFEKHKYRAGNQGQVMQSRILNVFDVGKKQNFVQVLGPVWYLWLIPVRNSIGNGWSFPASEFGKQLLARDSLESVTVHSYNHHHRGQSNRLRDTPQPLSLQYQPQQQQQQQQQRNRFGDGFDNDDEDDQQSYDDNDDDDDDNTRLDMTLHDGYDDDTFGPRRDSDESDSDNTGSTGGKKSRAGFFQPGTPRRFRKHRSGIKGFAPSNLHHWSDGDEERKALNHGGAEEEQEEEDSPEEALYDSDEPATIHF